ncbi:MAG: S1 RNA-binding domain-containing protein [Candidatus Dojkabacteria bacterium]|nr:S1 RNA-binding domain-containing protein [Candidatus Dojkabacteria bacterium]MDQ7021746.1 S1 RNA-binding domain-containing protein [Candidatus Dojkabacteria bacterium]
MAKITEKQVSKEFADLVEGLEAPKTFTKGQIIEGIIISKSSGEMIIDVNGRAEGVVYGREMKLDGETFDKAEGETVLVYVVNPENDEGQVELSIRKTGTARKWFELREAKEKDKTIKVNVIEANTGGVIVEIGGGLRGFVPSSQLKNTRIYTQDNDYSNKKDATKQLQSKLAELIDEALEVKVMEINEDQSRVILSEKLVYSDADIEKRNETLENLKVGDTLKGKVTGIAPFGLFVNAEGLEGLVHISEVSWDKVKNPADFYKVDDEVEVQVIGLSDSGKRVAYSIKRLQDDPWKKIVQNYKVGQVVKGKVQSIADYGAFVKVDDGLNGLIHISELSNKLVKNPADIVSEGEDIGVMIISISDEDRHLGLSLKRLKANEATSSDDKQEASTESEDESTEEGSETSREMEGLDELLSDEAEEVKE